MLGSGPMGIMGDSLRWKFILWCFVVCIKAQRWVEVSTNPLCPFCGCVCERYLYDGCSMCYRCVIYGDGFCDECVVLMSKIALFAE